MCKNTSDFLPNAPSIIGDNATCSDGLAALNIGLSFFSGDMCDTIPDNSSLPFGAIFQYVHPIPLNLTQVLFEHTVHFATWLQHFVSSRSMR
jgi:hypothetical protein